MTHVPICMGIDCSLPAEVILGCGGEANVEACFACADKIMRSLAPENVMAGASIEETAEAYERWRREVGRPVTREEAIAVATEVVA